MTKPRDISMTFTDNGGVYAAIGCKTLVFQSVSEALHEIDRYAANPDEVEREYNQKYGWEDDGGLGALAQEVPGPAAIRPRNRIGRP